jgi:hypothetical protein
MIISSGAAWRRSVRSRSSGGYATGAGCGCSKRSQTLTRADDDRWLLIVQGAAIREAADSEVVFRTAAIFVADVALAHIAGQDDHFFGRMEYACFAEAHVSLSRVLAEESSLATEG